MKNKFIIFSLVAGFGVFGTLLYLGTNFEQQTSNLAKTTLAHSSIEETNPPNRNLDMHASINSERSEPGIISNEALKNLSHAEDSSPQPEQSPLLETATGLVENSTDFHIQSIREVIDIPESLVNTLRSVIRSKLKDDIAILNLLNALLDVNENNYLVMTPLSELTQKQSDELEKVYSDTTKMFENIENNRKRFEDELRGLLSSEAYSDYRRYEINLVTERRSELANTMMDIIASKSKIYSSDDINLVKFQIGVLLREQKDSIRVGSSIGSLEDSRLEGHYDLEFTTNLVMVIEDSLGESALN